MFYIQVLTTFHGLFRWHVGIMQCLFSSGDHCLLIVQVMCGDHAMMIFGWWSLLIVQVMCGDHAMMIFGWWSLLIVQVMCGDHAMMIFGWWSLSVDCAGDVWRSGYWQLWSSHPEHLHEWVHGWLHLWHLSTIPLLLWWHSWLLHSWGWTQGQLCWLVAQTSVLAWLVKRTLIYYNMDTQFDLGGGGGESTLSSYKVTLNNRWKMRGKLIFFGLSCFLVQCLEDCWLIYSLLNWSR